MVEHLFRFVDGYDSEERAIVCHAFRVVKQTRCGFWISTPDRQNGVHGDRKFVKAPQRGEGRFAYPTEEEALNSYRIRKMRQIQHLNRALDLATRLHHMVTQEGIKDCRKLLWMDGVTATWWLKGLEPLGGR